MKGIFMNKDKRAKLKVLFLVELVVLILQSNYLYLLPAIGIPAELGVIGMIFTIGLALNTSIQLWSPAKSEEKPNSDVK